MNKLKQNKLVPNQLLRMPNADKDHSWNEKWSLESHGFDIIIHPAKCVFSGPPGVGKSNLIINLFVRTQESSRPFETVIVIGPKSSKEYNMIDAQIYLSDIPDDIECIIDELNGKTLLIIDDFEMSKMSNLQKTNLSMLFRYISSHHNISVFLSYQSFIDIPLIIRKCSDFYCIWKPRNMYDIGILARRTGYNKKTFQNIFSKFKDKFDFLTIDTKIDAEYALRKNLYEVIKV